MLTWRAAITLRLNHLIASNSRPKYVDLCQRTLRRFAHFSPVTPEFVTVRLVCDYLQHRLTKNAASSVHTERGNLCAALAWLSSEQLIPEQDWSRRVVRVRVDAKHPLCLTDDQVRRFLLTAQVMPHNTRLAAARDIAMLYTLLETGIREGELIRLKLSDLNLTERSIRVLAESAKSRKERHVFFSPLAANLLRRYLRVRGDRSSPYLWVTRDTGQASRSLVLTMVKRIGRACGMEDVTVHGLRHTFATSSLRQGMSLPAVSKMLGHSELSTTQRYLHLMDEDVKQEYERAGGLGRLMG